MRRNRHEKPCAGDRSFCYLPRMFRTFAFSLFVASILSPFAMGEQAVHHLRLLAVGDPPPFVQEVRDGVRYEVAAAAGTIPPRELRVPLPKPGGAPGEVSEVPLRLRLGQPSQPLELPGKGMSRVRLQMPDGARWLETPVSSSPATLAVVWRNGTNWDRDASVLALPDDAAARAEGNIHLTNLTSAPMAVAIGMEKLRLEPGRTLTRKVRPGSAAVPLEVQYPTADGRLQVCHSAMLEPLPGHFQRLLIHAADGRNARIPVRVFAVEEPS